MDTVAMVLVGLGGLVLGLLIYFVPTFVARSQHRRQTAAIFVLNLFLGWTFLFWVLALVWAVADDHVYTPLPDGDPGGHRPPPAAPPAARPTASSPTGSSASASTSATERELLSPGARFPLTATALLRVDPSPYSPSTGELRPGTEVTVLRTEGDWARVQTDAGQEGWIRI
jgi:hypothetical protein